MATIVSLGFGVVETVFNSHKLFTDTSETGGKAPDMRIDSGESYGSNPDAHFHMGDGEGQSAGGETLDFLFGAANTQYQIGGLLENRDYLVCDEHTLENLNRFQ